MRTQTKLGIFVILGQRIDAFLFIPKLDANLHEKLHAILHARLQANLPAEFLTAIKNMLPS
jgi:hypothetical protein